MKTYKRELAVALLVWLIYVVEVKDATIVEILVWPIFSFAAAAFGFDLDTAMDRIFESNMSKLGPDGKPIYRADGKVLKPESYKPPVLTDLCN